MNKKEIEISNRNKDPNKVAIANGIIESKENLGSKSSVSQETFITNLFLVDLRDRSLIMGRRGYKMLKWQV